jgi:uncharacterized protein YfdQ (DUF2303 family)
MTTEAQSIADMAVKAAGAPLVIKTEEGREFLLLPEGMRHQDVTEPNAVASLLPDHIKQGVTLQTVDSLVDYVNGFKTGTTILFADIQANSIKALLDYHASVAAGHVAHIATMALPFSEEWRTWTAIDGKLVPQLEFARFLEENAADISAPSGADLLEACRDLQARRKVNFTKAVRTSSDNENFEFTDETEARSKGGLEIPTKFQLSLPVYFGEAPVELYAFLRWKLDEGALTLGVKLHRSEHVRQAVFKQIVTAAAERTERTVVFGRPS